MTITAAAQRAALAARSARVARSLLALLCLLWGGAHAAGGEGPPSRGGTPAPVTELSWYATKNASTFVPCDGGADASLPWSPIALLTVPRGLDKPFSNTRLLVAGIQNMESTLGPIINSKLYSNVLTSDDLGETWQCREPTLKPAPVEAWERPDGVTITPSTALARSSATYVMHSVGLCNFACVISGSVLDANRRMYKRTRGVLCSLDGGEVRWRGQEGASGGGHPLHPTRPLIHTPLPLCPTPPARRRGARTPPSPLCSSRAPP